MPDQQTTPRRKRVPITPSTVTINGSVFSPQNLIWTGLRWHEARGGTHTLNVPWCHVDDAPDGAGDAVYRVRPRHPAGAFVQCRNGAWAVEVPSGH